MNNPIELWRNTARWNEMVCPVLIPHLHPDGGIRPLVLVLPGGGYEHLANHEGVPIAQAFNLQGFHAAVLKYRVASRGARHPDMIHDAQRAARIIRSKAQPWNVRDGKFVVLGFSAGGHLASSLAVHYDQFTCPDDELATSYSARPNAAVLCYPVIALNDPILAHGGSRKNLLGEGASAELVNLMSTHLQVNQHTPPTFLWHTADDPVVPVGNSIAFFQACRARNVPAELHVYASGRHGLGLGSNNDKVDVRSWVSLAAQFLAIHLK